MAKDWIKKAAVTILDFEALATLTPRIWFFEGLDKTGKTTLCRACRFSSGHAAPMYDRGFLSREVFYESQKEKNPKLIANWRKLEEKLRPVYGIVYLYGSDEVIQKRHKDAGERVPSKKQLAKQSELFRKNLLRCTQQGIPIIYVWPEEYKDLAQVVKITLSAMQLPYIGHLDQGDFKCQKK